MTKWWWLIKCENLWLWPIWSYYVHYLIQNYLILLYNKVQSKIYSIISPTSVDTASNKLEIYRYGVAVTTSLVGKFFKHINKRLTKTLRQSILWCTWPQFIVSRFTCRFLVNKRSFLENTRCSCNRLSDFRLVIFI